MATPNALIGIALGLLVTLVRSFGWVAVSGSLWHSRLEATSLPVVGDAIFVLSLVLLFLLVAVGFASIRALAIAIAALSSVLALLGLCAVLIGSLSVRAADVVASRLGYSDAHVALVAAGPIGLFAASIGCLAYSMTLLSHGTDRVHPDLPGGVDLPLSGAMRAQSDDLPT